MPITYHQIASRVSSGEPVMVVMNRNSGERHEVARRMQA